MTSPEQKGDHKQPYQQFSSTYFTQISKEEHKCGLTKLHLNLKPLFGNGFIQSFLFEGLSVYHMDITLKQQIEIPTPPDKAYLEMAFLTEGEQIIHNNHITQNLTCEGMEYYLWFKENQEGITIYRKQKRLKKLMIRLSDDFLIKNHLEETFSIKENYQITTNNQSFSQPFNTEVLHIITEIFEDKRHGVLKRLFLKSKILNLLTYVLDQSNSESRTGTNANDQLLKKLYQVERVLSENLSEQQTISDLSRTVGLNEFVLKKEFKALFGKTIFEYHLMMKMQKAKKLLQHPQHTIYEISSLVGYKNPTHFSAAFKRFEGVTPNKFRKQIS